MILDQKIEKKEKGKKKGKKKKRKENPGLTTTHFILLPPHQVLPPRLLLHPSRKQAERRGGSRGQGWADALTLVEGPPCSQGGGDPPHPTPIIWEKKNKRKRKFLGGGKNNQIPSFNYSCETKYWEGGGREGGASVPRSPPWAPAPRGLEIRHQIPHRTLMLKNGNQISLAGGQPGQGAGGAEGARVRKVMGEFMPPTSLCPFHSSHPRLDSGKQNYLLVFILWSVQSLCPCVCV